MHRKKEVESNYGKVPGFCFFFGWGNRNLQGDMVACLTERGEVYEDNSDSRNF